MSKTLVLMRHGQCLFNARGKIQGRCDSPLTPLGRDQARATGAYMRGRGWHFDRALCSTSQRTAATLELATRGTMPYERREELCEIDFGLFEGQDEELLVAPQPFGDFLVPFGGESAAHLEKRFSTALERAMDEIEDGQWLLIVAHGTAMLTFFNRWHVACDINMDGKVPGNGSILVYQYQGEEFLLQEYYEPRV